MAIAGLDESTTNFSVHPDYLSSLISSVLVQRVFGFIRTRSWTSPDPERSVVSEKLSLGNSNTENNFDFRHGYSNTAFFALPLCFLFASVAQFASLLAFPSSGDATCAFVVAWGGMAAQSGRLVGALIVIFELRRMGIARWEFWVAIVLLIIGIGFIFLNNAVAVGVLTPFAPLGVAYCDRKHFLPASLISSILYFALEVYAVARIMLFLSSGAPMRIVIQDIKVLRPLALVLLELLTLVPAAVFTNTVAEFIPFSIGAVAVLQAFSFRLPLPTESSPCLSALSYASYPSVRSVRQSYGRSSQYHPSLSIQSPSPAPPSPVVPVPARRHPFSASALNDPTLQMDEWNPSSARSTRTIDTTVAQSIHNAVVQVGQRARAASRNDDGPHKSVISPTQRPSQSRQLDSRIVPSQSEYAERLDLDYAQANSLPARPRPTVDTPLANTAKDDISVSDLVSPVSRSHLRLSRFGDRPSKHTSFRTSYRTSFVPDSVPSSPDSIVRMSITSNERRRSASLSLTQESSVDHRRSALNPMPERWPTFNASQFRAAGFGRPSISRASSVSSPPSVVHRPPALHIPPLPSLSTGIRQVQTPRGPRPPPLSAQFSLKDTVN
ncbi:hypothetical protein GGX14DRAFT_413912 [Mycena pura]|uniref:Uncharacterized protein n=1 Tax=Mycena pura TaxID=153505 RepID=A0AAD6YTB4_9AGAR|nr:hypothetical protein GGX14DRAFT_413912 [Mycena pura]